MQESSTELRIDYDVSRAEYVTALQDTTQQLLRSVKWSRVFYLLTVASVVCGVVIGAGYMELASGYIGRNGRWTWWIAVAFLSICLLTIWQQRLRAAQIYSAIAADGNIMVGPQALVLNGGGLVHQGRSAVTQVAWAAIKHISPKNNQLLIILNNYSFFVMPDRAFTNMEQRNRWLAALHEHVPAAMTDSAPVCQGESANGAPPHLVQPAQIASPMALGLIENLRAGARLAFFRRVRREDFVPTAEAFITLVVMSMGISMAFGVVEVGFKGQFNFFELPRSLVFVPLVLLLAVVAARVAGDRAILLALPVALAAAGLVISLVGGILGILIQQNVIAFAAPDWGLLFYVYFAWWSAIIAIALWRLAPMCIHRMAGVALLGVALLAMPSIWYPKSYLWLPADEPEGRSGGRENYFALADEKGFYAQHEALQRMLSALLPERPGIADLYTLTVGLYANEDVFMKEVKFIDALFRQRFDADGRALMLINNPKTVHEIPIASATSLSAALRHIGGLMNREEDVLILYVSSHGSEKHSLSVDFWPLRLRPIDPPALKQALDDSAIKWKVVVISACYSGGFVEPLQDDYTLIITASSSGKKSFGCGNESEATYLAKALFDEELRKTYSFEAAFDLARKAIRKREQAQGFEASDPQIFVGTAIHEKLLQVERRLSGPNR